MIVHSEQYWPSKWLWKWNDDNVFVLPLFFVNFEIQDLQWKNKIKIGFVAMGKYTHHEASQQLLPNHYIHNNNNNDNNNHNSNISNNNNNNNTNNDIGHSNLVINNELKHCNDNNVTIAGNSIHNFVAVLLEKYRALEADRNHYKKQVNECIEEKNRIWLEAMHWKQKCKLNNETFNQYLEMTNKALKEYAEKLEHKFTQHQTQLQFQQIAQCQPQLQLQSQPSDDQKSNGITNSSANISGVNNTHNNHSNSNNNGSSGCSAGSTPEQLMPLDTSIGVGNIHLAVATSPSSSTNSDQKCKIATCEMLQMMGVNLFKTQMDHIGNAGSDNPLQFSNGLCENVIGTVGHCLKNGTDKKQTTSHEIIGRKENQERGIFAFISLFVCLSSNYFNIFPLKKKKQKKLYMFNKAVLHFVINQKSQEKVM
ncbi:hypothetical protein RFI_12094 [Reticulomyxa filosa]|uniref:Uncharacterized protein n=1 Tax=Reticulomyxa filosa TaxID=46433 RepID=X6NGC5_RETFI|nr:hypothetical protein RFI_12094 [Reticulomyxa filosa]|eukprot:ETO25046.1 hypothetical protein RFI_12094 [Reticulomyxa filosa]